MKKSFLIEIKAVTLTILLLFSISFFQIEEHFHLSKSNNISLFGKKANNSTASLKSFSENSKNTSLEEDNHNLNLILPKSSNFELNDDDFSLEFNFSFNSPYLNFSQLSIFKTPIKSATNFKHCASLTKNSKNILVLIQCFRI
ncbi:MAG: hypothetical protein R3342_03970 [Lutibacter sp.]|uniref:hypothetical protein n=1 Tax=Lutibacter sp. TaxID=1925666 RepID=UPI00299CDDE0|nr:hypothetical protein [Lutibacter sp.]MDX1828685.1 hypothetical protein [Lutibacter sp.]